MIRLMICLTLAVVVPIAAHATQPPLLKQQAPAAVDAESLKKFLEGGTGS